MENDFSKCELKVAKRSWVCLAVGTSLIALFASFAAEQFPSERTSDAVFTGQVLSDELIQSLTNVISAKHGLYSVE